MLTRRAHRGLLAPEAAAASVVLLALFALLPACATREPSAPGSQSTAPVVLPAASGEPLRILADAQLDPARTYGPIVIAADGVTLEGRGAWIVGATTGPPTSFTGTGISAASVSNVTLRGVNVKGFAVGLQVEHARGWLVESCDFSDNFHDPDFGWGEQGRRGGIVLTGVEHSVLRQNRVSRVWDGCSLQECNDDVLQDNDFSNCSNTCLKLWDSSRNAVSGNNLSWGLRISPGETHARDSTGVLIESGSNGNIFADNDVTHGGDGIFIRVLNNWTSTGNRFERNDCSYANNNCFEAWSPGNTYVANTANHGSYGFWLGASDDTRLIGNEAGWNGAPDGHHNAPEAFGHGGIVFVNGPSNHTLVQGNRCHDNNGGGIVLRGDAGTRGGAWKAFHWVIQQNVLERNRWGVYLQYADWIDLGPNTFRDNTEAEVLDAGGVTRLFRHASGAVVDPGRAAPAIAITPDEPDSFARWILRWRAGEPARLAALVAPPADAAALAWRWDFGDGATADTQHVVHAWQQAGPHRVGLTADDGTLAGLASLDVFITDDLPELGTEDPPHYPPAAQNWTVIDETGRSRGEFHSERAGIHDVQPVVGAIDVHARIDPYDGGRVGVLWPRTRDAQQSLAGRAELIVWLRARDPDIPAWQNTNPVITLFESDDRWLRFTPARDLLGDPPDIEGRDDWNRFAIPLTGDALWRRDGPGATTMNWLTIGVDSWGWPPLDLWVDGLALR